jgi:hypothetical protein
MIFKAEKVFCRINQFPSDDNLEQRRKPTVAITSLYTDSYQGVSMPCPKVPIRE